MKTKVSIVKCQEYEENKVYDAIKQALKEINFKIPSNKKVLLKPNVLGAFKPEEAGTTHPVFVAAVCRILKEHKCKVVVGDSSGFSGSTKKSLQESGIQAAAEKYGANTVAFESLKIIKKKSKGKVLKDIMVPEVLYKSDIVINLPKLKTHSLMTYSAAVKNLFGLIPGGLKPQYHCIAQTSSEFAELMADIYQTVKPQITLTLMDAIVGMEGNGPSAGTPKKTGLIIASTDATAIDATVEEMIGLKSPLLAALRKRNLASEADVKSIPKIHYKKPSSLISLDILPKWLRAELQDRMVSHPYTDNKKCIKCRICEKSCPVKAIKLNPYPEYDRDKCIDCYCCHELCPEHAIYLKKTFFTKVLGLMYSLSSKLKK